MNCKNHSDVPAAGRCHGCAEGFCDACVVTIAGDTYCRDCKYMTAKAAPLLEEASVPYGEPWDAFKFGVVGIVFPIVSPWVIKRANAARRAIEANPELDGMGHAKAAALLGVAAALMAVAGIALRAKGT